jgi:response regulator RpfG family c-di-GMP phosphodiesterase
MRINFALKLYLPIFFISTIIGIFAYNMMDISSLVDKELKVANKKELQLEKDAKYIKNTLVDMKSSLIQDILNKKYNTKNLKTKFDDIHYVLSKIKNSSYFQTKDRKEILFNLEARINGYYSILNSMPDDFQDSYEDGTYSMLSLMSINKKLDEELTKLQTVTKDILNKRVFQIVRNKVEFYISILGVSLILLFFITHIIDNQILNSLSELKRLNHSFLLFVQQKVSKINKIKESKIPNDEIGDVIREISDNIQHVEQIINEDRELKQEIVNTQREIVFTMGAIGESRSKETGNHVKRVAEYSYLLATLYGLDEKEARLIKEASPMHDIGKVAIPDSILKKPGKLTNEEFSIMKTHSQLGFDMLKHSNRPILKAAAIIAYEHHEKYNGRGYPRGLKGDEIHIYGSITAIADVFDALGSDRVYKKAWSDEKIINLIIEETGEHFHPVLANLFIANFDKFVEIREKFSDMFEDEKKEELVVA